MRSFNQYLREVFPKFIYWKKATWTRSLWLCYDYMKLFLKYKDNNAYSASATNKGVPVNSVIWIYWRQGEDNAPELVKKCIESVRKNAGDHQIILLTEENLNEYILMPDFIVKKHKKKKISDALFTDLLRISLLISYGGIWCDATCFFTEPIYKIVEASPFFMFNKDLMFENTTPTECSSWFIKAEKGNLLLRRLRNILFHYFYSHNWLPNYYIFHVTLGLLIHTDNEVNKIWNKKPYICNMNPHAFFFSFQRPYDEMNYRHLLKSCFVHKLTYKYGNVVPGSMLEHFFHVD